MNKDIIAWVNDTNLAHGAQAHSCSQLNTHFSGFFSPSLLENSQFVIVDTLPSPPAALVARLGLSGEGLSELLSPNAVGLTLGNTYYLKPKVAAQLRVHFHELVHVLQWRALGSTAFIQRYMSEVIKYGYRQAPLEEKAYGFEDQFVANPSQPFMLTEQAVI